MFYCGFSHGIAGCSSGMSAKELYGLDVSVAHTLRRSEASVLAEVGQEVLLQMVVFGGCAGSNFGRIHCDVGTSAGSKQLGFGCTGSDWRHKGGSDNSGPSPM